MIIFLNKSFFFLWIVLFLEVSHFISETFSDSKTLKICCKDPKENILNASPEFIFMDVVHLISGEINDNYDLGSLSTHQMSLVNINVNSKTIQIPFKDKRKYSSQVLYLSPNKENLDLDMQQLSIILKKERASGIRKSYVLIDLNRMKINDNMTNFEVELEFTFAKANKTNILEHFDISNKLHFLTRTLDGHFESLELYSDLRGEVRKDIIHVKPYGLTVSDLFVPFNFHGSEIRATAVDSVGNDPVVTYSKESEVIEFLSGLGVSGLWDLRDTLNFSVKAMKGDADISPNAFESNPPVGLVHQLLEGEADVSILHTYLLLENVRHLKPLSALGEDLVYAIFRQPPSFTVHNVYTKPFKPEGWIVISSIWITITILLLIFLQLINRLHYFGITRLTNSNQPKELWEPTLVLLWSVCTLCQRSFFLLPLSTSLRVLSLYGALFSVGIYSMYAGQIISFLTVDFIPIKTLTELVNSQFEILSDPDMFFSYMLKDKSTSPEDYAIQLSKTYKSDIHSVKTIEKGYKVHLNTLDALYLVAKVDLNYSDTKICQLYSYVRLGTFSLKSGFYVKKNSPLQEPFNLKLIGIMERGLNHRYLKNYYEQTAVKCSKVKTSFKEDLGLSDVFTAFAILALGFLIACSILGFETFAKLRKC